MNPSERTQGLNKADQDKEHCEDQRLDLGLQEVCSNERILRRNSAQPYVRHKRDFETFVGGAGV